MCVEPPLLVVPPEVLMLQKRRKIQIIRGGTHWRRFILKQLQVEEGRLKEVEVE